MIKLRKEYSYLFCLGISFLIAGGVYFAEEGKERLTVFLQEKNLQEKLFDLLEDSWEIAEQIETEERNEKEAVNEEAIQGIKEEVKEEEKTAVEHITIVEKETEKEAETVKIEEPVFVKKGAEYFNDALFIGDSRTEGLSEYGNLGDATVFCDSGMSVYRLWKEKRTIDGKKVMLEEILQEKSYRKVYLMLGINELGYDHEQTAKRFRETIEKISQMQPEAMIFLMANLHVTEDKSKESNIYNNENINRINKEMEKLAKEEQWVYLDVNPVFDDGRGNLSKEYTADQAHILGIYYIDWVNWLLEHCIEENDGDLS